MKTIICAGLMLVWLGCNAFGDEPTPKKDRTYTRDEFASQLEFHIQCDALGVLVVLNELRDGRTNTVLEMLEFQVDAAVTSAKHRLQTGSEDQKKKATEFLNAVKDYRDRHPRKQEAKLDDGPLQKHLEATTKKANDIIKEMNTVSNKVQQVIVAPAPKPER